MDRELTSQDLRALTNNERLAQAELVELPFSEVCVYMLIAGQRRPVVPLAHGMAQILNADGSMFSIPVTRGEAGVLHVA